jgi:hypothetical protein
MDQSTMTTVVVAVLVLGAIGWLVSTRLRSETLRRRFGPEYERAVNQFGDRGRAESELRRRQQRVAALQIRSLTAQERNEYQQQWRAVQAHFADDPKRAVTYADVLLEDLMKSRGYPVSEFGQRTADLSVQHPHVVDDYRAAHEIALRNRQRIATIDELRQSTMYYRALFDELLEVREHPTGQTREATPASATRAYGEREVRRTATRDADGTEIPVKRSSDRVNDIDHDREAGR